MSSRNLDGTNFVIRSHLSQPTIDAKIWDVRRNQKYNKVCLTGALGLHGYQQQQPLRISRVLAEAIGNLLRCDRRTWERIDFEYCTGELDLIIAVGMAEERVKSIGFAEVTLVTQNYHALATGLKFNRSVSELRFRRCRISEGIADVANGLKCNSIIQSLTVEQCALTDIAIAELVESLLDCNSLQKLSLEGNWCRERGMNALAELLNRKRLQNLSLHNQRIEGNDDTLHILPLTNALSGGNSSLRFLDLSRNSLTDDDVFLLTTAMQHSATLETLHLDQNLITDVGAQTIAVALPSFRIMKTLAMPENPFGQKGGSALLDGMVENFIIETLIIPSTLVNIQRMIRYYGNLNKGGRRLFSAPQPSALLLFPLLIERVNNLRLQHDWNPSSAPADVIYGLLRFGPVLPEQKYEERSHSRARFMQISFALHQSL